MEKSLSFFVFSRCSLPMHQVLMFLSGTCCIFQNVCWILYLHAYSSFLTMIYCILVRFFITFFFLFFVWLFSICLSILFSARGSMQQRRKLKVLQSLYSHWEKWGWMRSCWSTIRCWFNAWSTGVTFLLLIYRSECVKYSKVAVSRGTFIQSDFTKLWKSK